MRANTLYRRGLWSKGIIISTQPYGKQLHGYCIQVGIVLHITFVHTVSIDLDILQME